MPFFFKADQKSATNHIFEMTVGLNPFPKSANLSGKSTTTKFRMSFDQATDIFDVDGTDFSVSISKKMCHDCAYSTKKRRTSVVFTVEVIAIPYSAIVSPEPSSLLQLA